MNWSDRTVDNELRIEQYTINDIMVHYLKDNFYVNRRYQRKLVWKLEEKQLLIDSILKGIPLPAILLAQYKLKDNNTVIREIVDGMQRLNAIISFMLGEFGVHYKGKICYFDPMAYPETFTLVSEQKLKVDPEKSVLPKEICQYFYRYKIPVIITGQDDETIELIFSRLNSTGRKISAQDLRQSRAVGNFPDLVRRIASRVRGDYTYDDRINLSDMPKISVGYGIDINTVFWRRHDLINQTEIKESKDEEIIETLLATVLLDSFRKTKEGLDRLYTKDNKLNLQVELKLQKIGKDVLEDKFAKVFDTFDTIFKSINSDFTSFICDKKKITSVKIDGFKILFLAIYNLLEEGYIIYNYKAVAFSIKSASTFLNTPIIDDTSFVKKFNESIDNVKQLLMRSFTKQIPTVPSELENEISKRLDYSIIESQMTEFKIGISNFRDKDINNKCIHQIAKTLVAMANTGNEKELGYVIIGIADSEESFKEWYKVFKESPVLKNRHYISGVAPEAKKLFGSTDKYLSALRKLMSTEPINNKLKDYILENFELITYNNKELIVFKSKYVGETSLYNKVKYVRQGNETIRCS